MANRWIRRGAGILALALASGTAHAQDLRAGRDKAQACTPCHGPLGIAVAPDAPTLAGENAVYIAAQLKAFRSGARTHHQMSIIAAGLSDADIADLAAWFDAIEVTATAPDLD